MTARLATRADIGGSPLEDDEAVSLHEAPDRHFHFLVWAYAKQLDEDHFADVIQIDLIGENWDDCAERAKRLVPVPATGGYRLRSIVEHFDRYCH